MPPLLLSFVLAGLQAAPSTGVPAGAPADAPGSLHEQSVVEFMLRNGWHFLLVPRSGPPVVAIETAIDVGAVDDEDGKRGLARLFADLTLQGTDRVGSTNWVAERVALATVEESFRLWQVASDKGADQAFAAEQTLVEARHRARDFVSQDSFLRYLENAGGAPSMRVECAPDWTRYAVSLPSNQLELWCWLEADRFTRPSMRGFFSERNRLLEARRRDQQAAPRATLLEQLRLSAFTTHPYRHTANGSVDDLSKLSPADAYNFFNEHYGAMRMVTTIVGDLDPERLRPMIERYFAAVPTKLKSETSAEPRLTESQPTLERRIAVSYAAPQRMALAWSVPAFAHIDTAAVEVTARILGPHPGSRLHRRLVREDALATDMALHTGWPGERSAHLVLIEMTPLEGAEAAEIERVVTEELARLRERGPSLQELETAQRSLVEQHERALRDPVQLARLLNRHHLLSGDWRDAVRHTQLWQKVSTQAVQAIVDVYFTDVRRTIAVLKPMQPAPLAQPKAPDGGSDTAREDARTEDPR